MQASTALGLIKFVNAANARITDHPACQRTALIMTVRRLTMSATAPAGKVNKKNGADAAVAIRESQKGEAPRSCISHVAVTSWEETNVPERSVATQSRQKIGLRKANHVEVEPLAGASVDVPLAGCGARDSWFEADSSDFSSAPFMITCCCGQLLYV